MIDSSWNIFKDNKIVYLPLGDDSDYDWTSEEIDFDDLTKIIENKASNNEVIGIELLWEKSEIGIYLLISHVN